MGEIRKDNLHESLIEELNELANIDLSGYQEKTDENLITESKDLVGAINELFQNANNGKELIASAIGEPVSKDDTFSAMSSEINGLLSTFKTNMMNNGVTVEANDRFKSLIDKISTLAEEGGNKGIKYKSMQEPYNIPDTTTDTTFKLDFTPAVVVVSIVAMLDTDYTLLNSPAPICSDVDDYISTRIYFWKNHNINPTQYDIDRSVKITLIENGFQLNWYKSSTSFTIPQVSILWHAIGVGEEDTTLLDSLKSILAEEGVTTTEEDDMASLISKVDTEFNEKNNEITVVKQDIVTALQKTGTTATIDESLEELILKIGRCKRYAYTTAVYQTGMITIASSASATPSSAAYNIKVSGDCVVQSQDYDIDNATYTVNANKSFLYSGYLVMSTYAEVYRNGELIHTTDTVSFDAVGAKSVDLNIPLITGDIVRVYIWRSGGQGSTTSSGYVYPGIFNVIGALVQRNQ